MRKPDSAPDAGHPKPRLPVGVSVLVLSDDGKRVLLGKRRNNTAAGLLSTPGGRIELKETMYECASRELMEETGLVASNFDVLGFHEHFRYGDHYIMFYLKAQFYSGTVVNQEPKKCEGWEWLSLEGILANPELTTEPIDILQKLAAPSAPASAAREIASSDVEAAHKWLEGKMAYPASLPFIAQLLAQYAAEQTRQLREELIAQKRKGIVELGAENADVMDYMKHWEGRAQAAEAERDKLLKYARHTGMCFKEQTRREPCNCGWAELERLRKEKT